MDPALVLQLERGMRPTWSGSLSFGLLQIPVQLYGATKDLDLHFRMLDGRDQKPIKYQRINTETGEEVPWGDIVKAYQYRKNGFLVVDEKELKKAAPEQTQTIDIETFVDHCDIDPIYFHKPYYVVPGKRAEKGYVLLRETLAKTGKVGIARVVIRTHQYLAALSAREDMLMLTLMRFAEEIVAAKDTGVAHAKPKISAAEHKMAEQLLESMSQKWNPAEYKEEFRTKLRHLLEERAKHADDEPLSDEKVPAHKAKSTAKVADLVTLLQNSLANKHGKAAAPTKTTDRSTGKTTAKKPARQAKPARRRTPATRATRRAK